MIFYDYSMFCCDAICVQDPVDTILTGYSGKSMMGTARWVIKGIEKGDPQALPGGGFIYKYPVVGGIKRCVEVTHENGRNRVWPLYETLHDESGAEYLNRRRKIEMGVDAGYFV